MSDVSDIISRTTRTQQKRVIETVTKGILHQKIEHFPVVHVIVADIAMTYQLCLSVPCNQFLLTVKNIMDKWKYCEGVSFPSICCHVRMLKFPAGDDPDWIVDNENICEE